MKLFCLPHAGGTAAHFRQWKRWLPAGVAVEPIDLPGHGTRLAEPLAEHWGTLVDDLVAIVSTRISGPYAMLGHSMGSLLAFEVTRRLPAAPELFIAAAHNGPSADLRYPPMHGLPDAHLVRALRRLGGIPDALLEHPELLPLFLPTLRADLRLAENYTRGAGRLLSCPLLVVSGRDDQLTDLPGLQAWARETTGGCAVELVDGGHFLLAEPGFAEVLTGRLAVRAAR